MKRILLTAALIINGAAAFAQVISQNASIAVKISTQAGVVFGSTNTTFASDTFTDTGGTLLSAHTADVGGGVWTQHGSYADTQVISNSNRARNNGTDTNTLYYAAGTPAGTDVEVSGDLVTVTNVGVTGIAARISTSQDTMVLCRYNYNGGTNRIELQELVNGVGPTDLTTPYSYTASGTFALKLEVVTTGATQTARCFKDGALILEGTTNVTASGRVGMRLRNMTDATGVHVDNFVAKNR